MEHAHIGGTFSGTAKEDSSYLISGADNEHDLRFTATLELPKSASLDDVEEAVCIMHVLSLSYTALVADCLGRPQLSNIRNVA